MGPDVGKELGESGREFRGANQATKGVWGFTLVWGGQG